MCPFFAPSYLTSSPGFPGDRRYHALGPALRGIFGGRARRVPLDAGFTCPNRDGALGTGGCLYCDEEGARAAQVPPAKEVGVQLREGIERIRRSSDTTSRFIAYLQSYTNTYAPAEKGRLDGPWQVALLRDLFDQATSHPDVVALAIGTRPDCLPEVVLDVLEAKSREIFLWVEMGLQSIRDATLADMHRGHDAACFLDAARRLRARSLRFVGHVIFGLPGDTEADMLAAADWLNRAEAWGVKIHHLFIDRRSPLAAQYAAEPFPLLSREQHVDLVAGFLARLRPDIVVHRLMGQTPEPYLVGPEWTQDKNGFLRALEKKMETKDIRQGCQMAAGPGER